MINTKKDLYYYIQEDMRVNINKKRLTILDVIKFTIYGNESYRVVRLLRALRYHEYYTNQCKQNESLTNKLLLRYYTIKHYHLELKYGIKLGVNVIGYGLYIPHVNSNIMADCISIGNYCSLNNGVIIGRNHIIEQSPIIGDYCNICVGSKIVRKVIIGNYVVVAPNSVVIEDVPDCCMVSGVPAKIVKTNLKIHDGKG